MSWGRMRKNSPSRSSGSDMKISISGLSSLRAAEITSRYMDGSLAIRALMPLAPVSWPRPLGGHVGALRHMVVYARSIALHYADRRDASPLEFCIDPHASSARWPGRSGTDQDCHSIVTTPWRTAKTRACSLDETSSLERMLVTWECTVPTPTCSRVAIS